jgi:hypothetical protein
MFTPASKKEGKLRLAVTGPSGSGKSWTSLTIASTFGGKIAAVDTENKSLSKYADKFKFDVVDFEPPFHPNKYIEAIEAAQSMGYRTIILDSLTHAWTGSGGIISIVDDIASHSKSQNSFFAWNEGGRLYNDLINAIVHSEIHVIVTIRSKQEYALERDEKGKIHPVRIGTKPIQRKEFEYEFDMVMQMDLQNNATVNKTRCSELPMGTVIQKPGAPLARTLMTWLVGAEWTDALDEKAVAFAAEKWGIVRGAAYVRLSAAVEQERLSEILPKEEFKNYVVALAGASVPIE